MGAKGFVPGIPARDLSPDEVEAYGGAEALRRCGLWNIVEDEGEEETPSPTLPRADAGEGVEQEVTDGN